MVDLVIILIGVAVGVLFGIIISYNNDKMYLEEINELQYDKETYQLAFTEVFNRLPKEIKEEYLKELDNRNYELDKKI